MPSDCIYFDDLMKFKFIPDWKTFTYNFFIDGGKYFIGLATQQQNDINLLFMANLLEDENGKYILFQQFNTLNTMEGNDAQHHIVSPVVNGTPANGKVDETNNLFFKLFQLSPLWMLLYSLEEGKIIDANKACLKGLGYSLSDLIGRSIYDIDIHPFPEEFMSIREDVLRDRRAYRNEYILRDSAGNLKSGIVNAEIVQMAQNKFLLAIFHDMTDYRRVQKELNESEQKFSHAFKLNPSWMGICRLDDGIFVEVNKQFLGGVGYGEDQIIGESLYSLNLIRNMEAFNHLINDLRRNGNIVKDIFEISTRAGTVRKGFLSLSIFKIKNEDHLIFNFDDRTVFIKLQEMLNDSEEQFHSIFDNTLAGFYRVSTKNGQIIMSNQHFARLLGFSDSYQVIGHSIKEFISNGRIYNRFIGKLYSDNSAILEMPIKRVRGGGIWVANYSRLFHTRAYYEGVIVDISERKRVVELLAKSENRFRTLIANSNDIIIIVDNLGRCQYVSPSISKVLGYSSRLRIKRIHSIVSANSVEKFNTLLNQTLNSKSEYFYADVEFIHKNGTVRILSLTASNKLYIPEIGGVIINAHDITDIIRAQSEITMALKKEQELHRQKNYFISTVSHDFRTPLTNISLNIQLLEKYLAEGEMPTATKSITRLNNATKRLTALINEVSLVSKEQSGTLKFNPEIMESVELFDKIFEQIDYLFQPKVMVDIDKGPRRKVLADITLITHIMDNILNNAIKFSTNNSIIHFSIRVDSTSLQVKVSDSGIGIPPEELKFLFDPYFRASNVSNIGGSGLGLSIVKRCVQLHNGEINIKSTEGKGTDVSVNIPV